jgi:hypothetical protein
MGVAPDVLFQIALSVPLADDAIAGIAKTVGDSVFTASALDYFRKKNITPVSPQTFYTGSVLSVGLWLGADERNGKWTEDGFTDAQRLQALKSSGFISDGQTAGFLFSQAMMQFRGRAELTAKPTSGVHPDSLKVSLDGDRVVTTVSGAYEVPVLPDIGYTYTVHELLSLDGSGLLTARVLSRDLDVSQLGIIADSFLIGLIEQGFGGIALIGGEIAAGTRHPTNAGVGSSLADSWPTKSLISKPIVGEITFDWKKLTVDATSVRTTGTLQFGLRQPRVSIVGPTAVSFDQRQPGVTETYSVALTELRPENAQVVWGDAAAGKTGAQVTVHFDVAGTFRITATVTDSDHVTATGATTVFVNVTKKNGGRTGAPP